MRDILDFLIAHLSELMQMLTGKLAGDMTQVDAWKAAAERLLVRYHLAAAIAGNGGAALTDEQVKAITPAIQVQLKFLDGFATDMQSASEFDAYWRLRAGSYAAAIKVPYWQAKTQMLPLPAMPAQGTQCMNNCKCLWRIEALDAEAGDYDAYWERHADDSCQTCVQREQEWSPVRIRGGALQL